MFEKNILPLITLTRSTRTKTIELKNVLCGEIKIIIIHKDCCFFEIDMLLKKSSCKLLSIPLPIIDFYSQMHTIIHVRTTN